MKRVITAINHPVINQYLRDHCPEFTVEYDDIQYQEGLLEVLQKSVPDALILNERLPGPYDSKVFIERLRQIDRYFRIIIIVSKDDMEFRNFLTSRGILDVLVNDQAELTDLIEAVKREDRVIVKVQKEIPREVKEELQTLKKLLSAKTRVIEKKIIIETAPQVQRQEIIAVAGLASVGKSDFVTQMSVTFAKRSKAKILLIDMNTDTPSLDRYFGLKMPGDCAGEQEEDKAERQLQQSIVQAIKTGRFDSSMLDSLVTIYRKAKNIHIFTANSWNAHEEEMVDVFCFRTIMEKAKEVYDFIFIDTSSNFSLAETKYAITSATRVFFLLEGTCLSLNRATAALNMFVDKWDIRKEKISAIVNKYSEYCIDKDIIVEALFDFEVPGFLDLDPRHYFYLNKGIPMMLRPKQEDLDSYLSIIEKFNLVRKRSIFEKFFKREVSKTEEKEIARFENQSRSEV